MGANIEAVEKRITVTPKLGKGVRAPPYWSVTTSDENCVLVDMFGTREVAILGHKLSSSLPNMVIEAMYRVQNVHLFDRYYEERTATQRKTGDPDVHEMLLFSGCHGLEPSEIFDSEEGFDFRLVPA